MEHRWQGNGGVEGEGEDNIDINEIMKIEEQPETALLQINEDNITYGQYNDDFQEDPDVVHNKIELVDVSEEVTKIDVNTEDEEVDLAPDVDIESDDEGQCVTDKNKEEEDYDDEFKSTEIEVPKISRRPGLRDIKRQNYNYANIDTNDPS